MNTNLFLSAFHNAWYPEVSQKKCAELINDGFHGLTQNLNLLMEFRENTLSSLIMNFAKRVLRNAIYV